MTTADLPFAINSHPIQLRRQCTDIQTIANGTASLKILQISRRVCSNIPRTCQHLHAIKCPGMCRGWLSIRLELLLRPFPSRRVVPPIIFYEIQHNHHTTGSTKDAFVSICGLHNDIFGLFLQKFKPSHFNSMEHLIET